MSLCGRYETAAAGGLIGYDFGPVDLQVWVTDQIRRAGYVRQARARSMSGRALASSSGDLTNRMPLVTKN